MTPLPITAELTVLAELIQADDPSFDRTRSTEAELRAHGALCILGLVRKAFLSLALDRCSFEAERLRHKAECLERKARAIIGASSVVAAAK